MPGVDTVLAGINRALRPGGRFLAQEYVDYRSFRIEPAEPVFERFLKAVRESWVHFGGDPDIGRRLPGLAADLGWQVEDMRPVIHATRPGEWMWTWPTAWLEQSPNRLSELGFLDAGDVEPFRDFIARRTADPASLLITPMVLEFSARKPGPA